MKTTTKRLFSLLLSVLMVLGIFGMCAFADEIDPNDYAKLNSECSAYDKDNNRYYIHDPATNPFMTLVKDYSCTEGLKEFYKLYYCTACEKAIKKTFVNHETGKPERQQHTFVKLEAKDPTCTETGLTEGEACKVCGKVKVAQEVIPIHPDKDKDGYCDLCKAELRYHCPYCGAAHDNGFWGGIVKWFHSLLASFGLKG